MKFAVVFIALLLGPSWVTFAQQAKGNSTTGVNPMKMATALATKIDLSSEPASLTHLISKVQDTMRGVDADRLGDFEIQVMKDHLQSENISPFHRVNALQFQKATLSHVLTVIVNQANPLKSRSGRAAHETIWAIAPSSKDPDKLVILVTTKTAALKNNYLVPAVFGKELKR